MAQPKMLKLDRQYSNLAFGSWRLEADDGIALSRHSLPGRVQPVSAAGAGFLHTRTVVTHNHLHEQPSGTYVFLRPLGQEQPALYRLDYKDEAGGIATHRLTDAIDGKSEAEATGGLLEPSLPASVAAVRSSSGGAGPRLLLSSGHGDLRLLGEQGAAGGQLRCVMSALRSKRGDTPAACEILAVTLQPPPAGSAESLAVVDVQLLQESATRPHAVIVSPRQDRVLLAVDPAVPSAPHTPPAAAAGGAPAGAQSAEAAVPAEEFDANPRSLQQAVENLARFTSEEPAGGPISERLADIDSETGPEGEGALGAEPEVALVLLSPAAPGSGGSPTELDRIACGTHRLLGVTVGSSSPAAAASGSSGDSEDTAGDSMLLGLTDDVDAAVVRAAISTEDCISAAHVGTVPALAYVVAGKVQRRAVMFGQPGAAVAAVIAEAHAYAFVYKAVAPTAKTGSNAIVQLGLPPAGLGVLGASLRPASSGGSRLTLVTEDAAIVVTMW